MGVTAVPVTVSSAAADRMPEAPGRDPRLPAYIRCLVQSPRLLPAAPHLAHVVAVGAHGIGLVHGLLLVVGLVANALLARLLACQGQLVLGLRGRRFSTCTLSPTPSPSQQPVLSSWPVDVAHGTAVSHQGNFPVTTRLAFPLARQLRLVLLQLQQLVLLLHLLSPHLRDVGGAAGTWAAWSCAAWCCCGVQRIRRRVAPAGVMVSFAWTPQALRASRAPPQRPPLHQSRCASSSAGRRSAPAHLREAVARPSQPIRAQSAGGRTGHASASRRTQPRLPPRRPCRDGVHGRWMARSLTGDALLRLLALGGVGNLALLRLLGHACAALGVPLVHLGLPQGGVRAAGE